MARRYVRDNRGRFASAGKGATARGGRLRTAAGNKRATQTRKINAKPAANTVRKHKGLQPGAIKPKARRSAATSGLRPGELMNANARPVNTMAKPQSSSRSGYVRGDVKGNIERAKRILAREGVSNVTARSVPKSRRVASADLVNRKVTINSAAPLWSDPYGHGRRTRREGWHSSSDPRRTAFHEAAHIKFPAAQHKTFRSEQFKIAGRVGRYARKNPAEFVSETYAGLKTGRKYDHQVMRLYREIAGKTPTPAARRRSRIRRKP